MLWILLLGVATGMRTMTAIAVLSWFAWAGLLPETTWGRWIAFLITSIIFTVFALGEDFGDTQPKTPSRTSPVGVSARVIFGAVVGALAAHANLEPAAGGVIVGVIGALIGTYGGHWLRARGAAAVGRDLPVALSESLLAILFSIWAAWMLHVVIFTPLRTFT